MRVTLPELFVNYVRNPRRESPINVGAARVLLGLYLIWNFASVDFAALDEWHLYLSGKDAYQVFQPMAVQRLLPVEQAVLLLVLVAFVLGYRERLTAVVSALLVAHLATVLNIYSYTGRVNSMFISAYFLLFFGLYAETDALSLDTVRGVTAESRVELREQLRSPLDGDHSMRILQLSLLTVAVLYFGSAWAKLVLYSPGIAWEWLSAGNLGRWTISSLVYWEPPTRLGSVMLQHPVLLSGAAVGTVVLEAGLLVVVLFGLPITPVVVGLLGMHTVITLALGPFFFDQYVFLALFLPWDAVYRRIAPTVETTVVYDEHSGVLGGLAVFDYLDTNDVIRFRARDDASPARDAPGPDAASESGPDPAAALRLIDDGVEYGGYFAVRELLRRYPLFGGVARLLDRGPVEAVGVRAYRRLAGEAGQCFVRRGDDAGSASRRA